MTKHWTDFLPEAGQIKYLGYRAGLIQQDIKQAEKVLARLKESLSEIEAEAFKQARTEWSSQEIAEAKIKAEKHNEKNETF